MIRKYQKEDISRIVELEKNHLLSTLGTDFYLNQLNHSLSRIYVLEESNKILGFLSSIYDGECLEILNFVIDGSIQSKGYGTQLMAYVLDEIFPHQVILEVRKSNVKAIGLYQKFGFYPISIRKEYYNNQEDAVVMQKQYDSSKDMIQLEAILFSTKRGIKYTSSFKERYCLNYYDLFDYKVQSLEEFPCDDYLLFLSNWYDEKLFQQFEVDNIALMHVNAYKYQSLKPKKYKTYQNNLKNFIEYMTQYELKYGERYAKKYAEFSYQAIQDRKMIFFSVIENDVIIGHVFVLEYFHSIFVLDLFVSKLFRHQGVASNLMDSVVDYAKKQKKCEIYLDVDLEDTPIDMYKKMKFVVVEQYYEFLKVS